MINLIKKLVNAYQTKRLANRRKAHNKEQLRQIYEGLIEKRILKPLALSIDSII